MYSVNPVHFNPKGNNSKYIRSSHPEHARINSYLQDKINQAKDAVAALEKEGKNITLQAIRAKINKPKTTDLFVFAEGFTDELLRHGNAGNYKKYRTIIKSLKDFTKRQELYFNEIDSDFLIRYNDYLKSENMEQTTIHGYIGRIRSLFNKAIHRGILEPSVSPFLHFKIKQGNPVKDRLSFEEINKIEELNYPEYSCKREVTMY